MEHKSLGYQFPDWLRRTLANPPQQGAGVHAWFFTVARQLHYHMAPQEVVQTLDAATRHFDGLRPGKLREIRDAVNNSREVAWQPKPGGAGARVRGGAVVPRAGAARVAQPAAPDSTRWPAVDENARRCRIAEANRDTICTVSDLWAMSESYCITETVDDWLGRLFPGAAWLCLAKDHPASARTRQPEKWTGGRADEWALVVPSPMTGPSGKALDGTTSHRCLGNTGPRRWLVIEFDSGTLDEQAALHWHLDQAAEAMEWPRLCLAVHSAGKSLHGWYGLIGDEAAAESLMAYARILGADTATWNRCQLVRLPGGLRTVGEERVRQEVHFWRAPRGGDRSI
jgi:hypothetical protein